MKTKNGYAVSLNHFSALTCLGSLLLLSNFSSAAADLAARHESNEAEGPAGKFALLDLESVVLTGQKAERSLQNTYDSYGFLSGQQLEDFQIEDYREAMRMLANVQSVTAGGGNSGFSIRGINSEGVSGAGSQLRPLASLVIDGATQSFEGARRGAHSMWDVKQLEVYRGAQSLQQGRNSLAGAIIVETNSPTPYWEGALSGRYGSEDESAAAFMISGPLLEDELMFRITGEQMDRSLDIDYSDDDLAEYGEEDYEMIRAKLLYTPKWASGLELEGTFSHVIDNPAVPVVDAGDPYAREFGFDGAVIAVEARENEVNGHILRASYDFNEDWKLSSITAYTQTDTSFITPQQPYNRDEVRADQDFSQEVRLNYGDANERAVNGMLGVFASRLKNEVDSLIEYYGFALQDLETDRLTENRAIFGEMNVPFLERWTLSVGLRYDQESFDTQFFDRSTSSQLEADGDFDAFLPKFALAYDLTDNQSVAFSYSKGYRAGFSQYDGPVVDAEYLNDYEIAYRSVWLDGQLRVNANVFFYDWVDQQVQIEIDPLLPTITGNAGKSQVFGGELEAQWAIDSNWLVGASIGYTKTKFIDFEDYDGNAFPGAPEFSGALWTQYDFFDHWFVAGDVSYVDSSYATADLANDDALSLSGYMLANLALGYRQEHWEVVLSVQNLFDKDYLVGRDSTGGAYVGAGRSLALSATLRF
ncbi:TonB-dependent receptor [Coraliomargarita sp. SDUM461004]|uniref:TonB-dependent receptor n=1 Tax=Thalassobacterium sedimentorum TaxID=3041258 RepID=A0ABU1AIM6_9BACT|nr:TonB-dependent receptor [Coraliomargarita sp. SDUM461004]MDQ8193478.1 TonB-dependent receptor [Coraliomargarita sp. SDUM461004]